MDTEERELRKQIKEQRLKLGLAALEYRNRKYPIYAWADHIYVALTLVALIVGLAILLISQDPYGWQFILLFLVAFIGGALMGRIERGWITQWMMDENIKNL